MPREEQFAVIDRHGLYVIHELAELVRVSAVDHCRLVSERPDLSAVRGEFLQKFKGLRVKGEHRRAHDILIRAQTDLEGLPFNRAVPGEYALVAEMIADVVSGENIESAEKVAVELLHLGAVGAVVRDISGVHRVNEKDFSFFLRVSAELSKAK